ncbi:MAG TPA: hypothetical protein VGR76_10265 [Candidatus Angelobacter sp.]|nr:hypothetical protein [Candidatus Angelobacter sp.]
MDSFADCDCGGYCRFHDEIFTRRSYACHCAIPGMGSNRLVTDWTVLFQKQAGRYAADAEGLSLRGFLFRCSGALRDREPDAPSFNQTDKNPDDEIEILGGCVTGRRGELDTAAAEVPVERAFVLHDHVGQRAVKNRDGYAQQQSRDFYDHMR